MSLLLSVVVITIITIILLIYISFLCIRSNIQYSTTQKIHFITFGNGQYTKGVQHLCRQANDLNCFTSVRGVTDPKTIPLTEKEILFAEKNSRGFGYWLWKPRLIQNTMSKLKNGEMILYVDGGCRLGRVGNQITTMADRLKTLQNKFFVAVPWPGTPNHEYNWTKTDLVDALQVPDHRKESILGSRQLEANIILIEVSPESRRIVDNWVQLMNPDRPHLFDDTPSVRPNHPNFVEHRHDQSIFSLLMKKHDACVPLSHFPGIYPVRNFRWLPGYLSLLPEFIMTNIM